jgi:hypothetical protein
MVSQGRTLGSSSPGHGLRPLHPALALYLPGGPAMLSGPASAPLVSSRERLAKRIEAGFRREFRVDADFEGQLSQRFRKERPLLEALFTDRDRFPEHLRWAQEIVEALKIKLSSPAAELRLLAQQDRLSTSLESISVALAHMHVNRMMLANPREHELIIHAFLHRLCRGRIARRKQKV